MTQPPPTFDTTLSPEHWDAVHRLDALLPSSLDLDRFETLLDVARALLPAVTDRTSPPYRAIEQIAASSARHDLAQTFTMLRSLRGGRRAKGPAPTSSLALFGRVAGASPF